MKEFCKRIRVRRLLKFERYLNINLKIHAFYTKIQLVQYSLDFLII